MTDLRTELLGRKTPTLPGYRMLLPPGWLVFDLGQGDEKRVLAQAAQRLASGGRPDLVAQLRRHVGDALADLRRQNGFAYAIPGEGSPTWMLGGGSLIGVKRTSQPDRTLDDMVKSVVLEHGAAPLGEDARILAWAEHRSVTLDDVGIRSMVLNYLIPVPGSRRTQAVHWVVNAAYPEDMPPDAPGLQAWQALFDAHVATFSWVNA